MRGRLDGFRLAVPAHAGPFIARCRSPSLAANVLQEVVSESLAGSNPAYNCRPRLVPICVGHAANQLELKRFAVLNAVRQLLVNEHDLIAIDDASTRSDADHDASGFSVTRGLFKSTRAGTAFGVQRAAAHHREARCVMAQHHHHA